MVQLKKFFFVACLTAVPLMSGCKLMPPESMDIGLGEVESRKVAQAYPPLPDSRWTAYITETGNAIAKVSAKPARNYRFIVIAKGDPDIFSYPDGTVFVTTGLLRLAGTDQDALSGLIAREVAHIALRHDIKRIVSRFNSSDIFFTLSGMWTFEPQKTRYKKIFQFAPDTVDHNGRPVRYSERMELEADVEGGRYMILLGQKPKQAFAFLDFLSSAQDKAPALLDGKPSLQKRLSFAGDYLAGIK